MAALVSWLQYSGARKSDGSAVASGYAYFLRPGTTNTQVTVYSDADAETPLTQPVLLDAGGRAKCFLNDVARIKIVDAAGADVTTVNTDDESNTIRAEQVEVEVDGIDGINPDTGATENGAPTDLATALGTLAEDIAAGVDDAWVRTQDYCAGDDATDDTTDFQTAISTAMANNKGLWIDPGTYRIASTLAVTGSTGAGLVIRGANRATCIIKNMDTANSAFNIDLSSAIESHITLSNFTVTANTTSSGKAILVTNGDGIQIERVNTALHRIGIDTTLVSHADVSDCLVTSTDSNASGIGIRLGAHGTARKCRVTAASNGIGFVLAGSRSTARDCRVTAASSGTGYSLTGTYSSVRDCFAAGATTAFSFTAADTTAQGCEASTVTTGFSVGAVARVRLLQNTSAGNTTDLTVNASATLVQDIGNTWTNITDTVNLPHQWLQNRRLAVSVNKSTKTTDAAQSYQPAITTSLSVHYIELQGAWTRTFTITNTSTTGLQTGDELVILFHTEAGSSWTTAWGTLYLDIDGSSMPALVNAAPVTAAYTYRARFIWNLNATSKWDCVEAQNWPT